jgi:hypothetical protein
VAVAQQRRESHLSPAPTAAASEGHVFGNRRSLIYHRPDCPDYGKVSPKNGDIAEAGRRRRYLCSRVALRSGDYSTMRVGLRATGRDRLWKLGEVAITAS